MFRLLRLALALGLLPACQGVSASQAPEESDPTPAVVDVGPGLQLSSASRPFIEVASVGPREGVAVLRAPARVAFRDGALSGLSAPMPGRVVAVHVETGASVKAGDPLVTLDCPDAASSRSSVVAARAAVRETSQALERNTQMLERGVGTQRELLVAERALAEAKAELARAESAARFVGRSGGTKVVLRAPISGTVVSRSASLGVTVEAGGDPLVEVGDPSALWVVAEVFERDLPLVQVGRDALVELPTLQAPLHGVVTSIGSVVDGMARTGAVRIRLDTAPGELRPGMFGRARIEAPDDALTVPVGAVVVKKEETLVYVQVGDDVFERRSVVVDRPVDGEVVVRSGLRAGESVVVQGALLFDGAVDQLL